MPFCDPSGELPDRLLGRSIGLFEGHVVVAALPAEVFRNGGSALRIASDDDDRDATPGHFHRRLAADPSSGASNQRDLPAHIHGRTTRPSPVRAAAAPAFRSRVTVLPAPPPLPGMSPTSPSFAPLVSSS